MPKRKEWIQIGSGKSYAHRVHRPLQCLIFITPLLLIYQIGSVAGPWSPDHRTPDQLLAFVLMLRFFAVFGAVGHYMPLLAVVGILMAWHLARKDKWDLEPRLYLGMLGESILWAIPCIVIGLAMWSRHAAALAAAPHLPLAQARTVSDLPFHTQIILSVGAGVYEELLFRLAALTLLNWIFVDVFELKLPTAIPLIILISALAFAGYHFLGTPFNAGDFFWLTFLGVYWAGIYIFRGYGITVGCHAAYDLIVVIMLAWRGH